MRNTIAIIFLLTLSALLVNAEEKLDDKRIHEMNDSESIITNDSRKLSKTKTKSFEKSMYFKNTRKIREAEIASSKLSTEGESAFKSDSLMRRIRSAEDNANDMLTTTALPLENDSVTSADTTANPIDVVETSTAKEADASPSVTTENPPSTEATTSINNFNGSVQTTTVLISTNSEDQVTSSTLSEESQVYSSTLETNSDDDAQATTLVNNLDSTSISTNDLSSQLFNVATDSTTAANVDTVMGNATNIDSTTENTENKETTDVNLSDPSAVTENKENDEESKDNLDELPILLTGDDRPFYEILPESTSNGATYVDNNNPLNTVVPENSQDTSNNINENNPPDTIAPEDTNNDGITTGDVNNPFDISTSDNEENNSMTDVDTPADRITANVENDETIDINSEEPIDAIVTDNTESNISPDVETSNPFEAVTRPSSVTVTAAESTGFETTTTSSNSSNCNSIKNYNFLVYGDSNIPCTLASMGITLQITYKTNDKKTVTKKIQVPAAAAVNGTCGENKSYLTLTWIEGSPDNGENSVTFEILRHHDVFYVDSIQVSVFLDEENFQNAADMLLLENSKTDLKLFPASVKNGVHVCHSVTEVICGKISVLIKDVSLVAYNDRRDMCYREEELCSAPRHVSIAAIIGGLVGIVVTLGIIASYAWYRKKTSTFRSELP